MAAKNSIVTRLVLENSGFAKKLDLSKAQVRAFDRDVRGLGKSLGKNFGSFASSLGLGAALGGTAAGLALVGGALVRATQKSMEFEVKMSEMHSLTGLATDDLNVLAAAAQNMGAKYGLAAGNIVDTMKTIGGALPELLQFKEGLIGVTEWVVKLSQASGLSMEEATASFTTALNQFGAGAEMAGVYANVLAAAAQAGSAEIPYLASALERAGGVAASLGMSFEDTVAIIETLAPKFGSAEEAGTALKNMLLGMEKAGGKVAISTNGFTSALDAYLAKQPSATKMMEDFGKSGMQAGLAIQSNREELTRFQKEITGTNAATEQAAINTDNLKGALDVLASKWDSFTLSVNNSNGVLTEWVRLGTEALGIMQRWFDGEEGTRKKAHDQGAADGVSEAINRVTKFEGNGRTREEAIKMAIREAESLRGKAITELTLPVSSTPLYEDAYTMPSQPWKVAPDRKYYQEETLLDYAPHPSKYQKPDRGEEKIYRSEPLTENQVLELEYKIGAEDGIIQTLRGMLEKKPAAKVTGDDSGKKKKGKVADPLEHSRSTLSAAGVDTKALLAEIKAEEKRTKSIKEIEAAITATADPKLRAKLQATVKELKAVEVPEKVTEDFKKLKEIREQLQKSLPDLTPLEIDGLAEAAFGADLLSDRIKGLETAIAATADPALRQRLRATLKELTALRDAEYIGNGLRRPDMQNAAFKAQLKADANRLNKQQKAREVHALLNPTNEWKQRRNEALGQGTTHAAIGFGADVTGVANNLVSSLGSAFSSLGLDKLGGAISTASSTISSLINVVTAASEVVNMVQSLTAAVAIPQEAANTAALVTNTGVLAANTTALVSLTSAVATNNVLGLIPGFADGGVVGGSSFTGDKLLARVNSGERILTRRQQEYIGRALVSAQNHTATPAAQSPPANIEVSGGYSIRGEDLYVTLRNHMRTHNKKLP